MPRATAGELRVYQYSSRAKAVKCISLVDDGPPSSRDSQVIPEEVGFQLRMRSLVHAADICCCVFMADSNLVLAGDAAGFVSLLDVSKQALLWCSNPASAAVVKVAMAHCTISQKQVWYMHMIRFAACVSS